jgi:hypothetical protein
MPRVKADTEEMLDIAARYERLVLELEDISATLRQIWSDLEIGMPGNETLLTRVEDIRRKAESIEYDLRDHRGKLRLAAERYDEYDRHIRHVAREAVRTLQEKK